MAISPKLDSYLTEHKIPYQMVEHHHSNSSISSAILANVPLNQIAKAVILEDHEDRKLMAVLPAKNKISLSALNEKLLGNYHLLNEKEVYRMFTDCEYGAIPSVGEAYNIHTVYDKMLDSLDVVYIEAGDHQRLLRINHDDFQAMVTGSKHLSFSHAVFH